MAGIYVHVPFCKQACHYCDFHFSTSVKTKPAVLQGMVEEMKLRADYLQGETVSTLYFGGGTPSILEALELQDLISKARDVFPFEKEIELTLEANPDDINREKLEAWRATGVNRLSIGIQSFDDKYLTWMNRAHNSKEALQCIEWAHELGFSNISIDLIYGLPDLKMEDWETELKKAIGLGIQHISAYCLTVEPDTALGHWVKSGKQKPMDEDAANRQFQRMVEVLDKAGIEQYEVSNFAKAGFESKHNTAYWLGLPYVGIGPSAHSFDKVSRAWNVSNNPSYAKKLAEGILPITIEVLSKEDKFNEYLMTSLRTKWGIDFNRILSEFDFDFKSHFASQIESLLQREHAALTEEGMKLTKKGLFFADGIASDFFILSHED
jgi:oxygen-independent coproporphyrinogen-3 oxidase